MASSLTTETCRLSLWIHGAALLCHSGSEELPPEDEQRNSGRTGKKVNEVGVFTRETRAHKQVYQNHEKNRH